MGNKIRKVHLIVSVERSERDIAMVKVHFFGCASAAGSLFLDCMEDFTKQCLDNPKLSVKLKNNSIELSDGKKVIRKVSISEEEIIED